MSLEMNQFSIISKSDEVGEKGPVQVNCLMIIHDK